jgi:thiol-disulfide isomerase/thioredoxin
MSDPGSPSRVKRQLGLIAATLIVLAFGAIIVAKAWSNPAAQTSAIGPAGSPAQPPVPSSGPAESHVDASAAYEKALADGKPVYLLFHSLTCVPCVEISAIVDKVVPDYEGRVVFVNAITTDEPSQRFAERFRFQYIPQSFFIDSKGSVVDSYTGTIDEASMRERLDRLAAQ